MNFLRVHPGQILEHFDHGGVVVPQHIQLQEVVLHGVVFKVGGDDVRMGIVRRVLDWAEIIDFFVARDDHHAARMLTGGTLDVGTSSGQTGLFRLRNGQIPLFQVL